MARDIRDLFKEEEMKPAEMSSNHEDRFLNKLDEAFPIQQRRANFKWLYLAASVVLFGSAFWGYLINQPKEFPETTVKSDGVPDNKTLGDVSPSLKKVEDYYLASINSELAQLSYTPENKVVFDGYLEQLDELNKEYENLTLELTKSGPTELTVNALIDNLKFRLNLLYRLKGQLKTLNASDNLLEETSQKG